jgi:RNA polymerase sigma-70 factor (ECF subfamily)
MSGDNATSLSLLERVRLRDQDAWQRLVELYRPLVAYWCRRWGADEPDTEDIVQEVFLAVTHSLDGFERQQPGSFRAWIRGITRHKFLDQQRRRQRQPAGGAGGTEAQLRLQEFAEPDINSEEEAAEISGLYRRALELIRLAFEVRTWTAFWRTAVDAQPTELVAAELGMSAVAVRIAKSRVLARLRQEVGDLIE